MSMLLEWAVLRRTLPLGSDPKSAAPRGGAPGRGGPVGSASRTGRRRAPVRGYDDVDDLSAPAGAPEGEPGTAAPSGVRGRRSVGWVRVVPAGEVRRPPSRAGVPRPYGRARVRPCAPSRVVPERVVPRGRLLAAVAAVVFLGVVGLGLTVDALAGAGEAPVPSGTEVVSVGAGESLWDVAERAVPEVEPSAVVARIQELNDLAGGEVAAGTPLVVPASR